MRSLCCCCCLFLVLVLYCQPSANNERKCLYNALNPISTPKRNERPTTDHHPRYDTGAAADAFLFALFISKEITTDSNTLYYMILLKCWPLMMFFVILLHIFFLLLCSPLFTATCLISFHFIWAFCCIYFKRYRNYIDHNDSSAPSILVLLFYRYGWFP